MSTPALARLVGAVPDFTDRVWGREPLLRQGASGTVGWPELLTVDDVDELLSIRGLRTPFLRMARSGRTLPERSFTGPGGVGAGIADQVSDTEVSRQFAEGATIVLQALHRNWPPLIEFTHTLGAELGHPVQVNAYVTPPQSQGFAAHYDVHDVFILQLAGTKEWRVHAPVHPWPMRDEPWDLFTDAVQARADQEPVLEAVLHPGDCLYLPRGYLHSAVAQGEVSAHLTLGVHTWTTVDLVRALLDEALSEVTAREQARAPLALGVAVDDPYALAEQLQVARRLLIDTLDQVGDEAVAERLAQRLRAGQRPEPVRPVALATATRTLQGTSRLRRRRQVAARLDHRPDGTIRVVGRGIDTTLGPEYAWILAGIPQEGDFSPDDLQTRRSPTADPGAGEPSVDAVTGCAHLLRAGLLVPAQDGGTGPTSQAASRA
ncbi:MAG: cupin-like domain-containing protein [Austwickia sp.]|nr:cupin-like domain-containing protein [Austwickia sp.]MBK9101443.1 cupin-like domain-containing protein [Austwickia sp.]